VADKPVAGLHEYVAAPLADSVIPEPLHIAADVGATIVGRELIVTVKGMLALEQPFALLITRVPVYVPAIVPAGTAIEIWPAGKDAFVTDAKAELQVIL